MCRPKPPKIPAPEAALSAVPPPPPPTNPTAQGVGTSQNAPGVAGGERNKMQSLRIKRTTSRAAGNPSLNIPRN